MSSPYMAFFLHSGTFSSLRNHTFPSRLPPSPPPTTNFCTAQIRHLETCSTASCSTLATTSSPCTTIFSLSFVLPEVLLCPPYHFFAHFITVAITAHRIDTTAFFPCARCSEIVPNPRLQSRSTSVSRSTVSLHFVSLYQLSATSSHLSFSTLLAFTSCDIKDVVRTFSFACPSTHSLFLGRTRGVFCTITTLYFV